MNIAFGFPINEAHWWVGGGVLALAVIVAMLRVLEKRRRRRVDLFVEAALAPRLTPGYDSGVRRPLFWLVTLGFVAVAVTLAQPKWGQAWQEVRQQSRDIMVCLDTSESMRAANPLPSRIERAKQKILSVLDRQAGDRFGLVAFAGAAAQQCPMTHDHAYVKAVLSAIDTDTISEEGTDIASAIREAVRVFKEEARTSGVMDNNSRAILIISDGEQVSGDAVAEAEKAADYARVFVIGVGDPNGTEITLPDWMGRYVQTRDAGKPHLSKLDEDTLMKVATAGKGGYIRSTPDTSDIEQIYDYIQKLAAYRAASDIRLRLVNRFQWPLSVAFLCFAGEGLWLAAMPLIRARRTRRAALERSDD